MGDAPPWYVALRAADRLHMSLPELLEHPQRETLVLFARQAIDAENHALQVAKQRG